MSTPTFWMLRVVTFMVVVFGCVRPCAGALAWTNGVIELDLVTRPEAATAVFPFRNDGTGAVRIAMVMSSCDCVTTKLEKEVYAPGESGEIKAIFKPEGSSGRIERTIAVVTDDTPETPTVLILRIQLPTRITVRPSALQWQSGESRDEKVVEISLAGPEGGRIRELHSSNPDFAVRLESHSALGVFRVRVKPMQITGKADGLVSVTAAFARGVEESVIRVAVE